MVTRNSAGRMQAGFPCPIAGKVTERNVVSNAASSDFTTVALSESQLERTQNVTLGSQLVFNCETIVNRTSRLYTHQSGELTVWAETSSAARMHE